MQCFVSHIKKFKFDFSCCEKPLESFKLVVMFPLFVYLCIVYFYCNIKHTKKFLCLFVVLSHTLLRQMYGLISYKVNPLVTATQIKK